MKKNANKEPIKIKVNTKSTGYEFSSGAFSQVILPALEAMTPGFMDRCGSTVVEVTSNNIRTDLTNIADSSLIRLKVTDSTGDTGEATVHVYLHKHSMLVQGSTLLAGVPVWRVCSDLYLTPTLETSIKSKARLISTSNSAITRKASHMLDCNRCKAPLKGGKGTSCQLCGNSFHFSCTDNKHKKKALTQKEAAWVCGSCRAGPASSQPSTASLHAPISPAVIHIQRTGPDDAEQAEVLTAGGGRALLSLPDSSCRDTGRLLAGDGDNSVLERIAGGWGQYPSLEVGGSNSQSSGSFPGETVPNLLMSSDAASPRAPWKIPGRRPSSSVTNAAHNSRER